MFLPPHSSALDLQALPTCTRSTVAVLYISRFVLRPATHIHTCAFLCWTSQSSQMERRREGVISRERLRGRRDRHREKERNRDHATRDKDREKGKERERARAPDTETKMNTDTGAATKTETRHRDTAKRQKPEKEDRITAHPCGYIAISTTHALKLRHAVPLCTTTLQREWRTSLPRRKRRVGLATALRCRAACSA